MSSLINPSLIRDNLIFYLDVENPKSVVSGLTAFKDLIQGIPLTSITPTLCTTIDAVNVLPNSSILVSGAGREIVNGIYHFQSLKNDRPYYLNNNNCFILWSGIEWVIGFDFDNFYFGNSEDVPYPWLVQTWSDDTELESNPPPVVTLLPVPLNKFLGLYEDVFVSEESSIIKNVIDQNNYTILLWVKNRDDNNTYNKTTSFFGQNALISDFANALTLEGANRDIKVIDGYYTLQSTTPRLNFKNQNSNINIFWNIEEQSWNIGVDSDPNKVYYKSLEDVTTPWKVSNWSPSISSAIVTVNTPTLSVLNQNNIFKFTGFINNNKQYNTNSVSRDIIGFNNGWDIFYRFNRYTFNFFTADNFATEPWFVSNWTARVSSLSTFSETSNDLAVNYITLDTGNFRVNSYGLKQIYLSESTFVDLPIQSQQKRIIHITQNQTFSVTGNTILWPTNTTGLNKTYSKINDNRFQDGNGNDIFNKSTDTNIWEIKRRPLGAPTHYTWYIANEPTSWPWEVTTWHSVITGWNIDAADFGLISGSYFTDGQLLESVTFGFSAQTGLWNYRSTDSLRKVTYREIEMPSTSFSFNLNYPPLDQKTFVKTDLNSDEVSIYRYNTSPFTFYNIIRDEGIWYIKSNDNFTIYQSEDIGSETPYDVNLWTTTVTALSTSRGSFDIEYLLSDGSITEDRNNRPFWQQDTAALNSITSSILSLTSNLVGFFNFDGDFTDASGNLPRSLNVGFDCNFNYVDSFNNTQAIEFTNFGTCDSSAGLTYPLNVWNIYAGDSASFSFWIKLTQDITFTGGCSYTFFGNAFGDFGFYFDFAPDSTNQYRFKFGGNSSEVAYVDPTPLVVGEWYNFIGTFNGNTGVRKLYKNNELMQEVIPPRVRPIQEFNGFGINGSGGSGFNEEFGEYGVPIIFDAVGLWDRVLTENEIAALYLRKLQYPFKQDGLQLVFAGDPDPNSSTIWGGAPTAWYYGVFDATSDNPYNTALAFSASNPDAEYPWNVEEWVPLEGFSLYQAPTAIPIVLAPFTTTDINRFTGLSGWVIENNNTSTIVASAADPSKVDKPWEIPKWINLSTGTEHDSTGNVINEDLIVTINPQISAWYWQYGNSFINAYSAESIETFPWDVDYALWQPTGNVYTGPAPKIIKPEVLPITVEPLQDDTYLNINFDITPYSGGSLLKGISGILGYKLENGEPRFSKDLGILDTEWHLTGLSVSGDQVKLYKDVNYNSFYESNATLGLSSVSLGTSNIDIGQTLIYNRQLTDIEILKIYKWFKGRYKKGIQSVGPITESIDPDAQLYIDITGATDIQGISNFVKGLKSIGLWDNIICWPLRLSQMTPSGNIVYSLGGLGEYSGNIINGSTREDIGLRLTNTQYISTNIPSITGNDPRSYFVVINDPNIVGFLCGEGINTNNRGSALKISGNVFLDFWSNITLSITPNKAVGGGFDTESYIIWSPVTNTTGNLANINTSPGSFFINQGNQNYLSERRPNDRYAFVMRSNIKLSTKQFNDLYIVYKNTLGRGLILT